MLLRISGFFGRATEFKNKSEVVVEGGKLLTDASQLTLAKKGESEAQIELESINRRFHCDCEKNTLYDFSCK